MAPGRKQTSTQKSLQLLGLEHPKPYRFGGEPERRSSLGGSVKRAEHRHVKTTGRYMDVANAKRQEIVGRRDRINTPENDNGHMHYEIPGNPGCALCSASIQPCFNYLA